MPEGTDDTAGQQTDPSGSQAPPWEAEGQQFDPERAWQLIQTLRTEREGLKSERDGLKTRVSEHEQASMTELEREKQRADEASAQVPTLQSENARLRAALEVGLDGDLIDRLRGATFEELKADAEQLKQRFSAPPTRFDHGPRQTAAATSMNDLILGGTRR